MKTEISFSIIIPTFNAGSIFKTLLNDLKRQAAIIKEIIVVDSSSKDQTAEIAETFGVNLITIANTEFDHGGTRNFGAQKASGDILLFITQDIVFVNNNLLQTFLKVFKDPLIGGAYARQLPRIGATPVEALSRRFLYPEESRINSYKDIEEKGVSALYFANPCACVRHDLFEKIGGFPNQIICNEDMALAYKILKAGYKTMYVTDAQVYHSHFYSIPQLFRRYFDIGVFFKSYPEVNLKAKNSSEGFVQTIKSLRLLISEKHIKWIPKFAIETITKFTGYNFGKRYNIIPRGLRKLFSMNRHFWEK